MISNSSLSTVAKNLLFNKWMKKSCVNPPASLERYWVKMNILWEFSYTYVLVWQCPGQLAILKWHTDPVEVSVLVGSQKLMALKFCICADLLRFVQNDHGFVYLLWQCVLSWFRWPDLGFRLACWYCSVIFGFAYIILKKSPYFKLYLVPVPPA